MAAQAARPQRRRRAQRQQQQVQRRVAGVAVGGGIEAMFAPQQSKRREEPPRCPERPAFHVAPPNGGWVNDPNAPIVDKDGRVHVVSGIWWSFFERLMRGGGIEKRSCPERASEQSRRRLWCQRRKTPFSPSSSLRSVAFVITSFPPKREFTSRSLRSRRRFGEASTRKREREGFSDAYVPFWRQKNLLRKRARATERQRRRDARRAKSLREGSECFSPWSLCSLSPPRHHRDSAGDIFPRCRLRRVDDQGVDVGGGRRRFFRFV